MISGCRPLCMPGRVAWTGALPSFRDVFLFLFFGGALIDHAAGDRDPAWASLGFRGLRQKLSSGSAFPEPPLAGDGLSGSGPRAAMSPGVPSALPLTPVPYQCLTSALPVPYPVPYLADPMNLHAGRFRYTKEFFSSGRAGELIWKIGCGRRVNS